MTPVERTLDQPDRRLSSLFWVCHAHHVEATGRGLFSREASKVSTRDRADVALLGGVNRSFRWSEALTCARLHLEEAEDFPVPANEIDFAATLRNPKVRSNDAISIAAKKKVGCSLSVASCFQMPSSPVWQRTLHALKSPRDQAKHPRHRLVPSSPL